MAVLRAAIMIMIRNSQNRTWASDMVLSLQKLLKFLLDALKQIKGVFWRHGQANTGQRTGWLRLAEHQQPDGHRDNICHRRNKLKHVGKFCSKFGTQQIGDQYSKG